MHRLAILLALVGCVGDDPSEIVGPFTGPRHRFVVDSFTIPMNNALARQLGSDLDGNGYPDNQFGMVAGTLAGQGNTTENAADMIVAGVIASAVEIQADDLERAKAIYAKARPRYHSVSSGTIDELLGWKPGS